MAQRRFALVDLPGTYSLAPRSPDEMVAVDVLLGRLSDVPRPNAVLCIVDASNLERNLYLVSQVLELGLPVVVALNMMDMAAERGVEIDLVGLERQLGSRVVAVQANRRVGLDELKAAPGRGRRRARQGSRRVRSPKRFVRKSSDCKRPWIRMAPGRVTWSSGCCWTPAATWNESRTCCQIRQLPNFTRPASDCAAPAARCRPSKRWPATAGWVGSWKASSFAAMPDKAWQ